MIAALRGRVIGVRLDAAVVDVGGVGMLVQATPATLASLRVGQDADLATTLVVKEDSLTLFGFADVDERDVFETLLSVSGIGPRLALAMLAVHTPDGLRRAVAGEDLVALCRVPGIGRKGAQRIVLELTDRLGGPVTSALPTAAPPSTGSPEVVQALVGLGWSVKQAEEAVGEVNDEHPSADMSGLLRAALRRLGRS